LRIPADPHGHSGFFRKCSFKQEQTKFKNLNDAQARLGGLGYYCISDRRDGHLENGFAVTREKIEWTEANNLVKVGAMGPEWRGIVWIGIIDDGLTDLTTVPDWYGTRKWGNAIAIGDSGLLQEIEERLQEKVVR
jgi:hypothetical protein